MDQNAAEQDTTANRLAWALIGLAVAALTTWGVHVADGRRSSRPTPRMTVAAAAPTAKPKSTPTTPGRRPRLTRKPPPGPVDFGFVRLQPGTFLMSDPDDADDPQHAVTLTKPFDVAAYPVTVGQFAAFVAATAYRTDAERSGRGAGQAIDERSSWLPGITWQTAATGRPDDVPATVVSWNDANAFCRWATRTVGRPVRLPTEAEWEYACRAGTPGDYNVDGAAPNDLGWFAGNSGDRPFDVRQFAGRGPNAYLAGLAADHCQPHPVGQKRPNAWGLYDMHGNVWQWCADATGPYPPGPATDPTGPADPNPITRRARGGSFCDWPSVGTSYNRGYWTPAVGYLHMGFRVVADVR